MRSSLVAVVAIALCLTARTAQPSRKITNHEALSAIVDFRNDPESENGRAAAAIIFSFAEQSPNVRVKISRKTAPFLGKGSQPVKESGLLLAAFIAGDISSQILRGVKEDDSYAGMIQLLATYRQLQQQRRNWSLAEVDRLAELEKRGQLKSYLETK